MCKVAKYLLHQALNRRSIGLLLLMLLAFTLRVWRLDLMEFKHDEAVAYLRATALTMGVEFPWTGLVSSKGIENFPLFLYLLGFFHIILHQPHQVVWIIALLNSVAVLLIFKGTRILLNVRTAWLTALLYATSPCAIFLSRKIWAQDLMPFWASAMFCLSAFLIFGRPLRKGIWSGLFAFLAVTSFQIHFSALFLLPAYIIVIWWNRASFKGSSAIFGAVAGLLPAIPYVIYQFGRGIGMFVELSGNNISLKRFHLKELMNYFVRQPVDEGFHGMLGNEYGNFLRAIPGYGGLRYMISALVVIGVVLVILQVIRGNRETRRREGFVLTLAIVPLALLVTCRISLIPSYFIIFYPLPFLFAALPIAEGWEWAHNRVLPLASNGAFVILIMIITGSQLIYIFCFLKKIDMDGGTYGDYGKTYASLLATVRQWKSDDAVVDSLSVEDLNMLALVVAFHSKPQMAGLRHETTANHLDLRQSYDKSTLTTLQRVEAEKARRLATQLLQIQ